MVLFNSIEFLFRFIPVFLVLYYVTPARFRDWTLLAGSAVFYVAGTGYLSLVLLALIPLNWLLGRAIYQSRNVRNSALHNHAFVAAVLLDAGTLVAFKILGAAGYSAYVPLGISFFIFKMIAYQADLLQQRMDEMPSLLHTALYFSVFTQVTQGPIMRYEDGNFENTRRVDLKGVTDGLFFFILGLSMKVLLADRLAILWNDLVKIGYDSLSTPLAWLGAYAYSLRLYMDFWGYSLMASGLGMMIGFKFVINFLHPYSGRGIADFYRRWHSSLGAWFRDYLYIPLGGSRGGALKTIRNLLIVWAATGFWHGVTPNFMIWSGVLVCVIIWEKYALGKLRNSGSAFLRAVDAVLERLHVLVLIPITWVVFAVTDLSQLRLYMERMFPFFVQGRNVNPADYIKYLTMYWPFLLCSVLFCLPVTYRLLVRYRRSLPVVIAVTGLFWVCVYFILITKSNAFMYFNF